MKRALIASPIGVAIIIVIAYLFSSWHWIYYISGTIGLICLGAVIFLYIDKLILGNKGTFSSEDGRKQKRTEDMKAYAVASIPPLMAALIYLIVV